MMTLQHGSLYISDIVNKIKKQKSLWNFKIEKNNMFSITLSMQVVNTLDYILLKIDSTHHLMVNSTSGYFQLEKDLIKKLIMNNCTL